MSPDAKRSPYCTMVLPDTFVWVRPSRMAEPTFKSPASIFLLMSHGSVFGVNCTMVLVNI